MNESLGSKIDSLIKPQIMNNTVCGECKVDFERLKEDLVDLFRQELKRNLKAVYNNDCPVCRVHKDMDDLIKLKLEHKEDLS